MMVRPYPTRAFLLLALLCGSASAQDKFPDDERRPNFVRPGYSFGVSGSRPGQFRAPAVAAFGKDNSLYIVDTGNHRIQHFSLDGKPRAQWGRLGSGQGEFRLPGGLAVGPQDEVYVADTENHRVQVFSADGAFLRQWGKHGRDAGQLLEPVRIAVCGELFAVVDRGNNRIQLFSRDGEPVRAIGAAGDGPGQFRDPADAACDAEGFLYVVDGNNRVQKFDPTGAFVLQWGSWGGHEGLLAGPGGIACHGDRVYVADTLNHRVQVFDRSGTFLFQWGSHPTKEGEGQGRLHFPGGIAVSGSGGWTAICEPVENRCQIFPNGSARNATPVKDLPWWDDMHARLHSFARMACPATVAARPAYWERNPPILAAILERENHAILFFDISLRPSAFLSRAGGLGGKLGEFRDPVALAMDPVTNRVYVCDRGNRRIQVLELPKDPFSTTSFLPGARVITAFEPARLVPASVTSYRPENVSLDAISLDREGRLYVADSSNAAVLVFDRDARFERLVPVPLRAAGETCRFSGVGTSPDLKTVYVADRSGYRILGLDLDGKVRSSWGRYGLDSDDGFVSPAGLAVDAAGCVYVSDSMLQVVKKFDPSGKYLPQESPRGMRFSSPQGILIPRPDRVIVDDFGNHRGLLFDSKGTLQDDCYKGGTSGPQSMSR
ncbi:MAG: 6-bladed beta-propeller [Planctomycetaceae bacterium]|nr:6-bladed beta-propeller [Planctomycetaceae bacterium]